jgi:hypothetical protein
MSLRERVARALDEFMFYRRRMLAGPAQTKTIQYLQPRIAQQPERKEQKIPLFGSDTSGFGEDYLVSRTPRPAAIGPSRGVDKPIVNRSGSLANLTPAHLDERPFEDPNTSMTFRRTSQRTDQQASPRGGGAVTSWDGNVLAGRKSSGLQGIRGFREFAAKAPQLQPICMNATCETLLTTFQRSQVASQRSQSLGSSGHGLAESAESESRS